MRSAPLHLTANQRWSVNRGSRPAERAPSEPPAGKPRRRAEPSTTVRLVALMTLFVGAVGCASSGPPAPASGTAPSSAVAVFLDHYELADGWVVRYDQGGDTVSEGQAYAMLVAAATGNQPRFEAARNWASSHLLRPDGLMAWHWGSGRVLDNEPAADADVVAAFAVFSAAGRFHQPRWPGGDPTSGPRRCCIFVQRYDPRGKPLTALNRINYFSDASLVENPYGYCVCLRGQCRIYREPHHGVYGGRGRPCQPLDA
jgi:glycosyl hydrolase family 8